MQNQRLLRLKDVKHRTGLGRSSIYSFMKQGDFPKNVQIGSRAVAWSESEIQAWIESRIAAK